MRGEGESERRGRKGGGMAEREGEREGVDTRKENENHSWPSHLHLINNQCPYILLHPSHVPLSIPHTLTNTFFR